MNPQSRNLGPKVIEQLITFGASVALTYWTFKWIKRKFDPYNEEKKQGQAAKKLAEAKKKKGRLFITNHEEIILCGAVSPEELDVTLEDVGGLENVKAELRNSLLAPLSHPELYTSDLLQPAKGILLYGAPGTGKTMLAKALALEANAYFLLIRPSMLTSKWYGDSQRLTAAIFSLALKLAPCIIFLDEVDSLLGIRRDTDHEATVGIKNEFMQLWDGFYSRAEHGVVVLGATNRREAIDPAALRRFTVQQDVGVPTHQARISILQKNLQKHSRGVHRVAADLLQGDRPPGLEAIAEATAGASGSDLRELCIRAARLQIADYVEQRKAAKAGEASNVQMPELRQEHLQKALGAVRSNVAGRRIPSAIQRASHAEAVNAPGQAQQLMAMMVQSLFQHQQPPQPAQQQQNGQHQQQADGSQGELGADDSPGSSSADGEDLSNGHGFEAPSADKGLHSTDSQPGRDAPEGAGVSPGKQTLSNGGMPNGQRQGVGAAGQQ